MTLQHHPMHTSASTYIPTDAPAGPGLRPEVSALPAYVPGRRATAQTAAALASNESHYDPLPSVLGELTEAARTVNRYPDIASIAVRERIAELLSVSAEEIAVGPGSVGVLNQIISAFCRPGDEVVFAWRSFEAYPILIGLSGATPVPVPLRKDEGHDLEAMRAAVSERTRILIICTPNNPTGVAVSHGELADFVRRIPTDILIVIDEAYVEYSTAADTPDTLELLRGHPNVCILRTFSKAYGLAGLRIGYAIAAPALAAGMRKTTLPFAVTNLAQRAAIASLDAADEMRARVDAVVRERERISATLRRAGWDVPDSEANFLWLRCEDSRSQQLVSAFHAADILVRAYPGDGVRISLADAASNDRVLEVLDNVRCEPDGI